MLRIHSMKTCLAVLLLLSSLVTVVHPDGIPLDRRTGRIIGPHTIITLAESQSEEIETLGTLTLTSEQWRQLRAIGPRCPKRFDAVLPITYRDPTPEGWGLYAIQLSRSEVAVDHDVITKPADWEFESEVTKSQWDYVDLYVDRRGQFYSKGVLIPFPRILELFRASSGHLPPRPDRPGKDGLSIPELERRRELSITLPVGLSRESAALKTRLGELYKIAKTAGWRTPDDHGTPQ